MHGFQLLHAALQVNEAEDENIALPDESYAKSNRANREYARVVCLRMAYPSDLTHHKASTPA